MYRTGNVSAASPTVTVTTPAGAGLSCGVSYQVAERWTTGFTVNLTITNTGTTSINGWTLAWDFTAGEQLTSGHNATWSQTGTRVTAVNPSWSQVIAPNASVTLGFQGTHSGSTPTPAPITINGETCTV